MAYVSWTCPNAFNGIVSRSDRQCQRLASLQEQRLSVCSGMHLGSECYRITGAFPDLADSSPYKCYAKASRLIDDSV